MFADLSGVQQYHHLYPSCTYCRSHILNRVYIIVITTIIVDVIIMLNHGLLSFMVKAHGSRMQGCLKFYAMRRREGTHPLRMFLSSMSHLVRQLSWQTASLSRYESCPRLFLLLSNLFLSVGLVLLPLICLLPHCASKRDFVPLSTLSWCVWCVRGRYW
jgi:hypothetical protein